MTKDSRRSLPPMSALHSFIAAAEHESFSKAAEEVGLTQSAVSRQIALLEDWMQVKLFRREGRCVFLTHEGRDYARSIETGLGHIRRATASLIARRSSNELNIATLPSFGMRWLAPRLPTLTQVHPELVINFAARTLEFDLARDGFDAAIHFGAPTWPGMVHDYLFPELAIPVATPALIAHYGVQSADDLARVPLLSLTLRPTAWATWFNQHATAAINPSPAATFEQFLMVAQAAAAGAGAALLPSYLIEPELRDGTLISLFNMPLPTDGAYYLVYPEDHLQSASFRIFREWILSEARHERSGIDAPK
jgi:LysR family transcriptional regulator, glycine cleavage system transcriptional activator